MYLDFEVGCVNGSAWVDFDPPDRSVGYIGNVLFDEIIINNKHLGRKYNERLERIMLDAFYKFIENERRFEYERVFIPYERPRKLSV